MKHVNTPEVTNPAPASPTAESIAQALMGRGLHELDPRAQKVARHMASRRHISRNLGLPGGTAPPSRPNAAPADMADLADLAGAAIADDSVPDVPSRGQRAADAVARFGGSWTFVALFAGTMLAWVVLNAVLLGWRGHTFDPFPYILLNLFLSMLAAIQAPVILMSQNRQSQKDRQTAEHDYEVNLKAELEIMLLHQKLDDLRQTQWAQLLKLQEDQLKLLAQLVAAPRPA